MIKQIILIAIILGCFTHVARADKVPALTSFVETEVMSVNSAVERTSELNKETEVGSRFKFKQFLIRLQAMIGLEVPWTASVQIVPEVELLWEKK